MNKGVLTSAARVLIAGAFLTSLTVCSVSGQVYHPLDVGTQWSYHSEAFGDQTMQIIGETVVLETLTRVRLQQESDQTYENFWTADAAGNLYLHGAKSYDGFQAAYLPPIQMVSAPLYSGKSWVTKDVHVFLLDGTPSPPPPFDYPLRVYSEGTVTVPAGDFYVYGVGFDIYAPPLLSFAGDRYDVLGRCVSKAKAPHDNTTAWYAEDIGLVMFSLFLDEESRYKLVTWSPPVANDVMTWGGVRNLFR